MPTATKAYLGTTPLFTSGESPSTDEWVRPVDWLPLPTLPLGSQQFVGLFAVYDHDSNFLSVLVAGSYTVNWGDGVVEDFGSDVQSYHQYNYADIDPTSESTRGYRQVLVTITPQVGQNLTSLFFSLRYNQGGLQTYNNPWLDVAVNGSHLTQLGLRSSVVNTNLLERVTVGETGTINYASFCFGLRGLQSFSILDTSNGTSFSSMFSGCGDLRTVPLFNTSNCTSFASMFQGCTSLKSVPLLDTSNGTNFSAMFQSCPNLKTVPVFNTSNGTSFANMFNGCSSLELVPLFNTSSGTAFNSMFQACQTLSSVPLFDTSSGNNFGLMFFGGLSLSKGALSGTAAAAISYHGCKLSKQALVDIFTALGTATGATEASRTITITNNWGASLLTTEDRLIATDKNWIIAG
jgi:hypothetical protein